MKLTELSDRYSRDEGGQWWYTDGDGVRKRCTEGTCEVCGAVSVNLHKSARFCSRACTARWRADEGQGAHAARYGEATLDGVKHNPNTMERDENGEWWYRDRNGSRARCEIRNCQVCGREYVTYPGRKSWNCSRACAAKNARMDPNIIPASRKKIVGFKGDGAANWRGGRMIQRGYVFIFNPDHPNCQGNGRKYVAEHRLVMEAKLGRLLTQSERVHHKNGIKTDNSPENLELWQHGHPAGQRDEEREPMIEIPVALFLALVCRPFTLTVA